MKSRPILFSAPMVRALLDGSKTQTRRIVKNQPLDHADLCLCQSKGCGGNRKWHLPCPYGQPGDQLWVRETTCIAPKRFADPDESCVKDYDGGMRYVSHKADGHSEDAMRDYRLKWTPSILVPRWASRITLEITGVRVERLKEINSHDALAEGVGHDSMGNPVVDYQNLWNKINGPGSWDANPWVWVIEFRKLETPENQ